MKYKINYECRVAGQIFQDSFEFESNSPPSKMDPDVVEAALRASVKFVRKEHAGVKILEINQGDE